MKLAALSGFADLGGALASTTHATIDGLQIHGRPPEDGEPDMRPAPEAEALDAMIAGLFESLSEPLLETCLEGDLADLLWSATDLFHRKAARLEAELDRNELRQKTAQVEQDGSEIKSVDLERLITEGQALVERRNVFEHLRDEAARHFEAQTGSAWRPRTGSVVNHKHLTAALLDSRDFLAAKRSAAHAVLVPKGPKIVISGGTDMNDHVRIWTVLDKILGRYPDMVLIHGGTPKGAERIAACWADNRKVTQIAFKPDWSRDGKAAPFRRNDRMLDIVPTGVVVFAGSGITDNLADKARKLGLKVLDERKAAKA